jgi:hypothetical protein
MKHPFSYVFAAVAGWFVAAPSTIDVEQAKSDAAALVAYATLAKASPLPTPPAPPAPVRAEPKALVSEPAAVLEIQPPDSATAAGAAQSSAPAELQPITVPVAAPVAQIQPPAV